MRDPQVEFYITEQGEQVIVLVERDELEEAAHETIAEWGEQPETHDQREEWVQQWVENNFEHWPDVTEWIEHLAKNAVEKPVYLHRPHRDEVFVINEWGRMSTLEKLANGNFEVRLETSDEQQMRHNKLPIVHNPNNWGAQ